MSAQFNFSEQDYLTWSTNIPSETAFTIMALVKWDGTATGSTPNAFSIGETGVGGRSLYHDESGWLCWDGATGNSIASSSVTSGTWYWVALRGNGTALKAFVRPEGAGSWWTGNYTQGTVTEDNLSVGRWINNTSWWQGAIIGVKQWSAALSDGEVDAELVQRAPVLATNLQRYIPLEIASDTADESGNGFNPTIGGTLGTDSNNPTTPEFFVPPDPAIRITINRLRPRAFAPGIAR